MATKEIDLDNFTPKQDRTLIGRTNGETMLEKLKSADLLLREIEKNFDHIKIIIPERIITINKSFFLGFLETRIIDLGRKEFKEKYQFETSEHILDKISDYVEFGLIQSTPSEILDV